jgi:hypothetical protein
LIAEFAENVFYEGQLSMMTVLVQKRFSLVRRCASLFDMLLDLNFFEGFEWPGSFPFVGLLFAFVLFLFRWRAKRNTIKKSPAQAKNVKRRGKYYGDDNTKELDFSNVQPYKLDFEIKNEDPIPWWKDDYISDRVYSATMGTKNLGALYVHY